MKLGTSGAVEYHEQFVGGLPHRREHDDRALLGEAEDEVCHLPHPLGRGHRRPAELHHDSELRRRAPVAASLLRSLHHRGILLLDNGGADGSLAPDYRLPQARRCRDRNRRQDPAPSRGGGTLKCKSQPRGGTESRRRHAGAARVGGVEREEEVEAPTGGRGEDGGE